MKIEVGRGISHLAIQSWQVDKEISFELTKDAHFEIAAESVALTFLRKCVEAKSNISVTCRFDPLHADEFGFFESLFGIYLCYCASSVTSVSRERGNLKVKLGKRLWEWVRAKKGLIGDAKKQSVVFRDDDYVVPECIKEPGAESFPLNDRFQAVLKSMVNALGVSPNFGYLSGERSLVTFLYEAARNSYEHGRHGSSFEECPGIRGITVEKLIFANEDDLYRREHSLAEIKEFIGLNWKTATNYKNTFIAITVSDLGEGIHAILPGSSSESELAKLNRALFTNATRKPPSDELERGLGLPNILDACTQLGAFLLVRSGDIFGYADYSTQSKYPKAQKVLGTLKVPCRFSSRGTSITAIWPVSNIKNEQLSIFE